MARKMNMPMPAVEMEYEPRPEPSAAQLRRNGMWYDAQMKELKDRGDHEAEYYWPNEERRDSNNGNAAMGFPGVLAPVRSSVGIRSIGQLNSEGCSLNTGHVYRGPRGGLKVGAEMPDTDSDD
jgi:hypothetical protein